MAARKPGIGYILSLSLADNVFMGGAMVTDIYGLPLEFRYTEPVRATKLQRLLYGDVLEKYIHADVIASNLVSRLEQSPPIFIVADLLLMPAFESSGKMAMLLHPSRVPPLKEFGAQQEAGEEEFLLQLTDSGSPVRVRVGTRDKAKMAEAARVLTETGRTMDIMEPVARVEAAIKMLWEEAPETPAA